MAKLITMPRLSDTMEEGTVVKWHKKLGDKVSEGDLLAEIETDKAVQEFESEYDGYLLHLGVPEGHSVTVNSTLAIIGPKGTEVKSILTSLKARDSGTQDQVYTLSLDKDNISIENRVTNAQARILASPLAKKIAKERSISLSEIKGSGENGRIIKRDIEKYQLYSLPESQDLKYLPKRIPIPCRYTSQAHEVPNSSMRKVIAKRLSESKFIAPHYYLIIEVDMQNAIASREAINASIKEGKISFNDMVIKASAMALREHPQINTSWKEDKIIYHNDINIGVAVAIEKHGLLVPVIAGADYKSLREISFEVKDKATRARSSKLKIEEMNGSTFTISNLGMFGIEMFTSIINQPNSSILSVGAILEKPIVKNSQIIPGNLMKLSLACDHRTIDGAIASEYLQSLKRFLENPVIMIA